MVLDAPDGTSLWLELTFVSSDFLLGNDLGFGTLLTSPELTASYLGRKVLAVGHLATTDHMMLQFAFGRASNLHRRTHFEIKPFKTQMPHAHRIHEASNANGKAEPNDAANVLRALCRLLTPPGHAASQA